MPLIRDYGLNDSAAAEKFVSMALEEFDYIVDVLPGAWAEMEQNRASQRMASVRVSLLEYMSAAYAMQDIKIFQKTCDAFLAHGLTRSRAVVPTRAQLATDLALAISRGHMREARDTCARVLSGPKLADEESAAALCAYALAALVDLDYRRAEISATLLIQQCEAKKFSKFESTLHAHWAHAAEMIARRDDSMLDLHFQNIADTRRLHIDRELARWNKGQPTELSATDFWDWSSTALASIAQSFGYRFNTDGGRKFEFADNNWTEQAG
jgi:hypothetical protein